MYKQIRNNEVRTFFLIIIFLCLFIGLGWLLSYYYDNQFILYFAVVLALIQSWTGYYYSDKIALMSSGARGPIKKSDNRLLWNTVENLCITAGMPMPKIYIIPTEAMNAFATGRDPQHSSLAVTSGIIEGLDKTELEGVISHELSHIKNYDIRVMSLVVVLAGVIAIASDLFMRSLWWGGGRSRNNENNSGGNIMSILAIVGVILAPIAATLIQLSVSRNREYLADASGALLTRYPEGLASALRKISQDSVQMEQASNATAHLFIANPFKGENISNLFSTHPPIKERIKRLNQMEIDPS